MGSRRIELGVATAVLLAAGCGEASSEATDAFSAVALELDAEPKQLPPMSADTAKDIPQVPFVPYKMGGQGPRVENTGKPRFVRLLLNRECTTAEVVDSVTRVRAAVSVDGDSDTTTVSGEFHPASDGNSGYVKFCRTGETSDWTEPKVLVQGDTGGNPSLSPSVPTSPTPSRQNRGYGRFTYSPGTSREAMRRTTGKVSRSQRG